MSKAPLLVAWFPFLLPALTQHLWNLPCRHRLRSLPPGHWQLVGKPPGQPRVMKPIKTAGEWDCEPPSPHPTLPSSLKAKSRARQITSNNRLQSFPRKMQLLLLLVAFLLPPRAGAGKWASPPSEAHLQPIFSGATLPAHSPTLCIGHIFEFPVPQISQL